MRDPRVAASVANHDSEASKTSDALVVGQREQELHNVSMCVELV